MELNKDLHTLIQRTWDLHDEINAKVNYQSISFCKHCLEQGLCCGIGETTMEERKRLAAIRDSLKDVLDMLVFLQTLESRKQKHANVALARLEASRLLLVEKINQYPGLGSKLGVLEDLNAWFGNEKMAFLWKLKENRKERIGRALNNGRSRSIFNRLRSLFNPWKWYCTSQTAIKLFVISTVISFSIGRCRSGQPFFGLPIEFLSNKDPKMSRELALVKNNDRNGLIDVLQGRG